MGQATRTTKLLLDLGKRAEGGANTGKRIYLEETTKLLNTARAFYVSFFLAHSDKLTERVRSVTEQCQEERERLISSNELLTWAESLTVSTSAHPHPLPSYNFTCFARLKVYTGAGWAWHRYPVKLETRWRERDWEQHSPKLVLRRKYAALHFSQVKVVGAKKVKESREDPHLVTVAVDLNVRNLAVITVRQDAAIIETFFVTDRGLDRHRYGHLKRIAKKQWQSGSPVKGEHSNQQLWGHVQRMNDDAAKVVARRIVDVCAKYPGCVLLFERLRKIKT